MDSLEQRIQRIEERNKSVEIEKAWETSWTRTGLVAAFTWITMGVFLSFTDVGSPWLSAIVPALGFVLSSLSMPYLKRVWSRKRTIRP